MKKTFFTTGQFASICETTKETLRHYNNIGLLKPEMRGDNGYQYYSYRQLYDFYLISTLKNTGCTLNKLNEYITKKGEADFRNLLESQLEQILVEKYNIEKREQIIKQSIKKYDLIKEYKIFNKCYVEEEEERYFIMTPVNDVESYEECMKSINNHVKYCNDNNFDIEYQLTYIDIDDETIKVKKYYVASEIYYKVECERLHIKNKGRYIKFISRGEINEEVIYRNVREYAKENKILIGKCAYQAEISLYRQVYEGDCITEISVQIE